MKEFDPINPTKIVLSEHLFQKIMCFFTDIVDFQGDGDFLLIDGRDEHCN
jgi:hypothetical protein